MKILEMADKVRYPRMTTAELRAPAEMEPASRAVLPARLMIRP